MTVTVASFRLDFPEFNSTTTFPDAQVNFWLGVAGKRLDPNVWDDMIDPATELYIAHNLALGAQAARASATGGAPIGAAGAVASKSVGGVSVGYDTGGAQVADGGNYNLTNYGTRFLELVGLFGAGGIAL